MTPPDGSPIQALVARHRVLVCVGSGGVGKTTTSAVLGLEAARQGRRVLVMTVDPARRLATSLGLARFDTEIQPIALEGVAGSLHATMLDMKLALDETVRRHAPDAATRDRILANPYYERFSTSLAGAQEFAAAERLLHEVQTGRWDLVVLDTPPTTHALDFLDAPRRFHEALDTAALQWVVEAVRSSRSGPRALLQMGASWVIGVLGRFTGMEFFEGLLRFLSDFSTLFEAFRERTRLTGELFRAADTGFVIVTSAEPTNLEEALYFRGQLAASRVNLGAMVANRVRQAQPLEQADLPPAWVNALLQLPGSDLVGRPPIEAIVRRLHRNVSEWNLMVARDREVCDALAREVSPAPLLTVPLYAEDVHDLERLQRMRADLCAARAHGDR